MGRHEVKEGAAGRVSDAATRLHTLPHKQTHNRRRRFNYTLPTGPALVAWSKAGPGHTLAADALESCGSAEQGSLMVKKFVRDTWDDPSGLIGGWGEPDHGAYVDETVAGGLGL